MYFVFTPRAKTERLPYAKPPSSPWYHLAKSGYKHQRISPGRYAKPLCYSLPETPALAWSCVSNGRQSHPKGLLVWRACSGSRPTGRPTLRFKDVCRKGLKTCGIKPAELEVEVSNRTVWSAEIKESIKSAEENRELEREQKRTSRHQRSYPVLSSHTTPATDYTCSKCQRCCKSRIGFYSHSRRCSNCHCLTKQKVAIQRVKVHLYRS
ncbi:hypothetical protein ElyMa_003466800 [Elysia marginata]|uniref:Uncharacterized protein n=1 Tax=Elysia marginata TaxID=1093978 RepID=A0AAV4EB13_9GAST|nr:hypothetical protein ElyMa_003466800 [Elysia marginata]